MTTMTDPFAALIILTKKNEELIDLVKKSLANPPNYTINSERVAEILATKIPNPTGIVEAIKKERESFADTVNRIPKSLEIKGSFYGFTSQEPFLAYWILMIFTVIMSCYFTFRSTDDERVKEFRHQVEEFRRNNPKVADKYFGSWYERNIESPVKELFK
jgi:predicted CopG family antitoxin